MFCLTGLDLINKSSFALFKQDTNVFSTVTPDVRYKVYRTLAFSSVDAPSVIVQVLSVDGSFPGELTSSMLTLAKPC